MRRQLYQLSQRLTLQQQLNEQDAQARQYQQQLTATRQALETTLLTLSLNVPEEGTEAAWLNERETEFAQWQEKQTQHGVMQERMTALMPAARHPAATNDTETEPAIPDNWRATHDECVSLQSQLATLQQQESLESERLQHATTHFTAALTASCFADREAFLAALLDEETIRRLEHRKQTLENPASAGNRAVRTGKPAAAGSSDAATGRAGTRRANPAVAATATRATASGEHHSSG